MQRQKIMERDDFSYDEKIHMYHKSNGRCAHCGKRIEFGGEATVEHFIPLSKGGTNRDINMIMLCDKCNKDKSNKILAPENYLKYLDKKYYDQLNDYFDSYIHSFEFMSSHNFFACDEYVISAVPEVTANIMLKKGRKNTKKITDQMKIDYTFARSIPEDIPRLQNFYIDYLKKYDCLDSVEAACDNISFWQNYGAIYYLEKQGEIKMMVPMMIAELDSIGSCGMMIYVFSSYSNRMAKYLAMKLGFSLPQFIINEQNLKEIKATMVILKKDPLSVVCARIGNVNEDSSERLCRGHYCVGNFSEKTAEELDKQERQAEDYLRQFLPSKEVLDKAFNKPEYENVQWMINMLYPEIGLEGDAAITNIIARASKDLSSRGNDKSFHPKSVE